MSSCIAAKVYDGIIASTPSDTANDPNGPFAGLYVTSAGTLKILDAEGNTSTLSAVAVGEFNVRVVRVFLTGTSATVFGLKGTP